MYLLFGIALGLIFAYVNVEFFKKYAISIGIVFNRKNIQFTNVKYISIVTVVLFVLLWQVLIYLNVLIIALFYIYFNKK